MSEDDFDEAAQIHHVLELELTEETHARYEAAAGRLDWTIREWAFDTLDTASDPESGTVQPIPEPTADVDEWEAVVRARRGVSALAACVTSEVWADMKGRVEALVSVLGDQHIRYGEMHGLMTTAFARRQAEARVAEGLLTLAERLFALIDRETWRATGGDDGQGHYEGDYRAEGVEAQLVELRKLFPRPEPGEAT